MKSLWLVALLFSVFLSGAATASADGWALWPFAKKSPTTETKKKSAASRFSQWKNPAVSLGASTSTTGRTTRKKGPSALTKLARSPKTIWDKTSSVFKSPVKKPVRRPEKKKFSILPASWFVPIEEEPTGPRSVTEWMKQPRLDP